MPLRLEWVMIPTCLVGSCTYNSFNQIPYQFNITPGNGALSLPYISRCETMNPGGCIPQDRLAESYQEHCHASGCIDGHFTSLIRMYTTLINPEQLGQTGLSRWIAYQELAPSEVVRSSAVSRITWTPHTNICYNYKMPSLVGINQCAQARIPSCDCSLQGLEPLSKVQQLQEKDAFRGQQPSIQHSSRHAPGLVPG